jgi:hypothetical protein
MNKKEPSSAAKIVVIAHQQTLGLLLWNCYYLTSPQIFNYIWSYRTPIQASVVLLQS